MSEGLFEASGCPRDGDGDGDDFSASYRRVRRMVWVGIALLFWSLIAEIEAILVAGQGHFAGLLAWVALILFGSIVGMQAVMTAKNLVTLRSMRSLRREAETQAQMLSAVLNLSDGVLVAVSSTEDSSDLGRDIGPGHPLFEAAEMAKYHGRMVCAHVVRTEDGWEVLRAHYPDGAEFGPHEPSHQERR